MPESKKDKTYDIGGMDRTYGRAMGKVNKEKRSNTPVLRNTQQKAALDPTNIAWKTKEAKRAAIAAMRGKRG